MFLFPTGGHGMNLIAAHEAAILEQTSGFLCRHVLGPRRCTPG